MGAELSQRPPHTGCLISGRWLDAPGRFAVRDKYTGETIAEIAEATPELVELAVEAVGQAFARGAPPPLERSRILMKTADLLEERRSRFIDVMVAEAGFTLADASGDVDRTLVTLRLCAEEATRLLGDMVSFAASPGQHRRIGFTVRHPLGIVCAITPFNSPLNTVVHKVGPALAAGNAVVLKPSGLTPLSAALLCEILLEAGLPEGLLALVQGRGGSVGTKLVENQKIAFYSFTGSTRVGRIIQKGAGLRRTQMELGSIASTILCADADLDRAIPKIINASFRKAGQVCTSTQRLYVEEAILDEASERLVAAAAATRVGDPRAPETQVGPMISEEEAQRAENWIEEARMGQARVLYGGVRRGPVLVPTILAGVRSGMKVVDQEIFAPCVSILPFSKIEEAIAHANNTAFGLSAGIFTSDVAKALTAAGTLRFGGVHINEASSARGDGMPFGGLKESGFGHEGPKYAIREVTEERLVTLNPDAR